MTKGETKTDVVERVNKYIEGRLKGENKMQSATSAGYSINTSKKPSLIELTNTYGFMVQSVLLDNALTMTETIAEFAEIVKTKPIDWDKAKKAIDVIEKQTKVHDTLTPKVTLKESTDKNGNVTRTAWAQNASQVQEVMTDKEDIEGKE